MSGLLVFGAHRSRLIALAVAAIFGLALVAPAMAINGVSQVINGGSLTATVADLTLTAVSYSHSAQTQTGSMTLTVNDMRGVGDGWNVTIQTSAFVYSGSNNGTNIAAANFALTSASAPTMTAGQAIDVTNGPKVPATSPVGALSTARKVIQANSQYGVGTYTQALGVELTIPAMSRAGTYTGTLTMTATAGP